MHIQLDNQTIVIPDTITPKGRTIGLLAAFIPLTQDGEPATEDSDTQEDFGTIEGYSVYYGSHRVLLCYNTP